MRAANANGLRSEDDGTPIHTAVHEGREAMVQLLFGKSTNVDDEGSYGRTSLWHAAGHGHEAIVRQLLNKDSDSDQQSIFDGTALYIALMHGHKTEVQLLSTRVLTSTRERIRLASDYLGRQNVWIQSIIRFLL